MNAEGKAAKSKLVIDEDWKTRVESEKAELEKRRGPQVRMGEAGEATPADEAARDAAAEPAAPGSGQSNPAAAEDRKTTAPTGGSTGSASPPEPQLPPASIGSLFMMLASQAMVEMGQIPDPLQQKRTVRKSAARHYIDTLEVLEEKTKGNLTTEESRYLAAILNELRMAYLQLKV